MLLTWPHFLALRAARLSVLLLICCPFHVDALRSESESEVACTEDQTDCAGMCVPKAFAVAFDDAEKEFKTYIRTKTGEEHDIGEIGIQDGELWHLKFLWTKARFGNSVCSQAAFKHAVKVAVKSDKDGMTDTAERSQMILQAAAAIDETMTLAQSTQMTEQLSVDLGTETTVLDAESLVVENERMGTTINTQMEIKPGKDRLNFVTAKAEFQNPTKVQEFLEFLMLKAAQSIPTGSNILLCLHVGTTGDKDDMRYSQGRRDALVRLMHERALAFKTEIDALKPQLEAVGFEAAFINMPFKHYRVPHFAAVIMQGYTGSTPLCEENAIR